MRGIVPGDKEIGGVEILYTNRCFLKILKRVIYAIPPQFGKQGGPVIFYRGFLYGKGKMQKII